MKTGTLGKTTLACCALAAGGCGGFPELLMNTARTSAKEAIQEKVDQVVNQVIDETVGAVFDEVINEAMGFDQFGLPILDEGSAEVPDDDVIENEGDGEGDGGRDSPRSGRGF